MKKCILLLILFCMLVPWAQAAEDSMKLPANLSEDEQALIRQDLRSFFGLEEIPQEAVWSGGIVQGMPQGEYAETYTIVFPEKSEGKVQKILVHFTERYRSVSVQYNVTEEDMLPTPQQADMVREAAADPFVDGLDEWAENRIYFRGPLYRQDMIPATDEPRDVWYYICACGDGNGLYDTTLLEIRWNHSAGAFERVDVYFLDR